MKLAAALPWKGMGENDWAWGDHDEAGLRPGTLHRLPSLQKLVDPRRHLSSFGNGPDDERGAAFGIAACKDAVEVGHEVFVHQYCAALIVFHAEAVQQTILYRAGEAHREQNQIRIHLEVAVGNRRELAVLELHLIAMELHHLAIVASELRRRNTPLPVAALFMCMRGAKLHRPERPRRRAVAGRRRLRQ